MTDPIPCPKCGLSHARCTAHRRDGQPCQQPPIAGATVCRMHGGRVPAVAARARERVLETRLNGELIKRGWQPVTDPIGHYADAAGEAWAWKELCREKIAALHDWETSNATLTRDIRPMIALYERAQERALHVLHDMLRLGLDHEALRQAKERPNREQADGLARIIDHVLNNLDLTTEQRQRVPALLVEGITKEMHQ